MYHDSGVLGNLHPRPGSLHQLHHHHQGERQPGGGLEAEAGLTWTTPGDIHGVGAIIMNLKYRLNLMAQSLLQQYYQENAGYVRVWRVCLSRFVK